MTKQLTIKDFSITWTADHEQYYPGHGIAFTPYTHCATGCGSTLREAFENALEDLAQQDIDVGDMNKETDTVEYEMLVDLTSQVKEPAMLDQDIVQACCDVQGEHTVTCPDCDGEADDCETCEAIGQIEHAEAKADCAVCAGEWHFYVSINVTVEGAE